MRLVNRCAPKGAQFFLILVSLMAFLLSFISAAHTVVLSEYSLQYKNERWILSFDQKTSQLRDAIYADSPDLKGMNMNSDVFLEATANLIRTNLTLTYGGRQLRIEPTYMQYGGLKFESTFSVEGMPEDPDYLTIRTDGFDAHEHSVMLFRVTVGKDAYLNYFNQDQRLATYDFETHHYVFEEIRGGGKYTYLIYGLVFLTVVAVGAKLLKARRVV